MLEIFAVKNAHYLADLSKGSSEEFDNLSTVVVFPEEGFEERIDGKAPGIYKYESKKESYITDWQQYPQFIDFLSNAILQKPSADIRNSRKEQSIKKLPFYELIDLVHFGLRNGTIGPVTSLKLAKDFVNYKKDFLEEIAKSNVSNKNTLIEIYEALLKQFEYASQNGFVLFT